MKLNDLHILENSTVEQILRAYFDLHDKDLITAMVNDQAASDMLDYWASCNRLTPHFICDVIEDALSNKAEFSFTEELADDGRSYIRMTLLCNGVDLELDWYDD